MNHLSVNVRFDIAPARAVVERIASVRYIPRAMLAPVAIVAGMYLALRSATVGERRLFSRWQAFRVSVESL